MAVSHNSFRTAIGARLAGSSQQKFHAETIGRVIKLNTSIIIKVSLLGATRSEYAISFLEYLYNSDRKIHWFIIDALGKIGSRKAIEILSRSLKDPSVHIKAIYELGEIGNESCVLPLSSIQFTEDSAVCYNAVTSLIKIGSESAIKEVMKFLESSDSTVRVKVICELGRRSDLNCAVNKLIELLDLNTELLDLSLDSDEWGFDKWNFLDRRQVIIELSKIEDREIRNILNQKTTPDEIQESLYMNYLIYNYEENYEKEVDEITGHFYNTDSNPLIDALEDYNWEVNCKAARVLGNLKCKLAVPALIQVLQDYERNPAWEEVAIALGKIGNRLAIQALIQTLKHEDWSLRLAAVRGLGEVKRKLSKKNILAIADVLNRDKEPMVRITAAIILGKIGGEIAMRELPWCILFDEDSAVMETAASEFGKLAQYTSIADLWYLAVTADHPILLNVVSTIQERCQFYNYAIAKSDPPPAVSQDSGVGNHGQTINNFNIETLNANNSNLNLGGNVHNQIVNKHQKLEP